MARWKVGTAVAAAAPDAAPGDPARLGSAFGEVASATSTGVAATGRTAVTAAAAPTTTFPAAGLDPCGRVFTT